MSELTATSSLAKPPVETQSAQPVQATIKKRKAGIWEQSLLMLGGVIIYFGWLNRAEEWFDAESGWGYALGIIGGSFMLILMLYPLRKYARFMRNMGDVRYWFRAHMFLGVSGPVIVLFHSNFTLGSVNSNVALFSMLTVACSGLIGRFVYSRIHYGLYGRKASLIELQTALQNAREKLEKLLRISSEELMQPLTVFEQRYMKLANNYVLGILILPLLPLVSFLVYLQFQKRASLFVRIRVVERALSTVDEMDINQSLNNYAKRYLLATSKYVEFIVYERIFSLWHMLHLPLFIIMISTGLFHVYAVHMY